MRSLVLVWLVVNCDFIDSFLYRGIIYHKVSRRVHVHIYKYIHPLCMTFRYLNEYDIGIL